MIHELQTVSNYLGAGWRLTSDPVTPLCSPCFISSGRWDSLHGGYRESENMRQAPEIPGSVLQKLLCIAFSEAK